MKITILALSTYLLLISPSIAQNNFNAIKSAADVMTMTGPYSSDHYLTYRVQQWEGFRKEHNTSELVTYSNSTYRKFMTKLSETINSCLYLRNLAYGPLHFAEKEIQEKSEKLAYHLYLRLKVRNFQKVKGEFLADIDMHSLWTSQCALAIKKDSEVLLIQAVTLD